MPEEMDSDLKKKIFASLKPAMVAIVDLLGPGSEVVLHDMADPDASIVAIEGDVTGRCVGGPLTDSGLASLRSPETGRVYSYTTVGEGGRVIKSSSVFLSDDEGAIFGGLCINLDITPYLTFERHLQTLLKPTDDDGSAQTFGSQVGEVLETMVSDAIAGTGIPVSLMQRGDRLRVIRALEEKGAFMLKKAVPLVAELLSVSRHTIYSDLTELEESREEGGGDRGKNQLTDS
ncbi:MAG TPA: PAS domain-containing protein [Anaerolineae bacterium]|nr:PAS domain-containing protein [Anaerolineae bacterium]HUW94372.1 PAS domain-containing protein [Anaerolineae bacterium]